MFNHIIDDFMSVQIKRPIEDIEQDLILEGYLSQSDLSKNGLRKLHMFSYTELFSDFIIVGDNLNKAIVISKFDMGRNFKLKLYIQDSKLFDKKILSLINAILNSIANNRIFTEIHNMYNYRKATNNSHNFLSFGGNIDIREYRTYPLFAYFFSFSTAVFLLNQGKKHITFKLVSLLENQLSSLPHSLDENQEYIILNKIADNLIKNLLNSSNSNLNLDIRRNRYLIDCVYNDLLYKKNFAISRYIIPYLIKKVKLSDEILERFVYLCQVYLLDIVSNKLVESKKDLFILDRFKDKIIFDKEMYNLNDSFSSEYLFSR